MQDTFNIGLVVKPQGVRGEVKVQPLTDDVNRFKKLKEVLIDQKVFGVTGVKISCDAVILSLDGITDRNVAELFRGKFLRVKREDAVKLKENSFFIEDLVGCKVYAFESLIGELVEITKAKTDIFTVKTKSGKIMRFPFLKTLIVNISVEDGKIVLDADRLKEVSCYED